MNEILEIIDHQEKPFKEALTDTQILWAKESFYAKQAMEKNDLLLKTAINNKISLCHAIINIAAIGISINPILKHAYLVPRKVNDVMSVCVDISYQGLLNLAQETNQIKWGQAKLVYEKDEFIDTGIDTKPIHNAKTFGDRGELVGVYCTVKTLDGDYLTETMNLTQINQIRSLSKAANGPWKDWFDEMARKSVIKRASKCWPKGNARFKMAVNVLNEHEGNPDIDETLVTSKSEKLGEIIEQKKIVKYSDIESAVIHCDDYNEIKKLRETIKNLPVCPEKEELKNIWVERYNALGAVNERN